MVEAHPEMCVEYFDRMRRNVYQTPKSFLSFLESYKVMYAAKLAEVKVKERNVALGLKKLAEGAKDFEKMKIVLAKEEVKLQEAERACTAMLSSLEISSLEAKKEITSGMRRYGAVRYERSSSASCWPSRGAALRTATGVTMPAGHSPHRQSARPFRSPRPMRNRRRPLGPGSVMGAAAAGSRRPLAA